MLIALMVLAYLLGGLLVLLGGSALAGEAPDGGLACALTTLFWPVILLAFLSLAAVDQLVKAAEAAARWGQR